MRLALSDDTNIVTGLLKNVLNYCFCSTIVLLLLRSLTSFKSGVFYFLYVFYQVDTAQCKSVPGKGESLWKLIGRPSHQDFVKVLSVTQ